MNVDVAGVEDLPRIQEAYEEGRRRQRERSTVVWPEFSGASLLAEAREGRLFRVLEHDAMVGTFAITYEDPVVWGERERGAHVYLHRIARGRSGAPGGLLPCILEWACAHSRALRREGIRMDTAARSSQLVAYCERAGFVLVGRRMLGPDPALPAHYDGCEVDLLEMTCGTRADE